VLTRLLAATALAATATVALAQTAPTSPAPSPAPGTTASGTTAPGTMAPGTVAPAGSRTYAAISAAKTQMAAAIEIAERTGGAGKAIDVEFERRDGNDPAHYEIKVVYPDGKLVEHYIDAANGNVIRSENQPFERYFTRLKAADFGAAKVSLREAVAIAERHVGAGARAVDVEVERDGNAVLYEVEVETPTERREVRIDANGQVAQR
jgi:uncharacterized membrane protein YkoI